MFITEHRTMYNYNKNDKNAMPTTQKKCDNKSKEEKLLNDEIHNPH